MVGATFPVTFMKLMEVSRTEGGEGRPRPATGSIHGDQGCFPVPDRPSNSPQSLAPSLSRLCRHQHCPFPISKVQIVVNLLRLTAYARHWPAGFAYWLDTIKSTLTSTPNDNDDEEDDNGACSFLFAVN